MTLEASCPGATGNDVDDILDRCRLLIRPALQAALEELSPEPRRMASYAVGLSETDGTPRSAHGGKRLRPAITVLCAQAAGGSAQAAIAGAVAVELVHAFSLVHDDIIDQDERRRHRPTVWKAYGIGPAVLSGDALLALAVRTLTSVDGAAATTAVGHLSTALIDLIHGQSADMSFEHRPYAGPGAVTAEEYGDMAARKTGALLGCAAAVGTLLGGGSPERADLMARMGRHLGIAFQVADDLLAISGDPEVTGKPLFNDLRQAKKTLPVIYALQNGAAPGRRLAEMLAARPDDTETLRTAAGLVDTSGGRAYARRQAEHHLEQALALIAAAGPRVPAADDLTALAYFLVNRAH
jgi:geranylgeranyl diphosphate synthase type I